jgi:protein-tyrosine-phosphatase
MDRLKPSSHLDTLNARPLATSFPRRLRPVLQRLRRALDRLLHTVRRRVALARLRRTEARHVLVVCHGNICRSPFAAAALARALTDRSGGPVTVTSAGFIGPGRPAPSDALATAALRGLDLAEHRSRHLSADMVRAADLILVMDTIQRDAVCRRFGGDPAKVLLLGDLDPLPIETRTIPDPILGPRSAFESSYARIERCVEALARTLATSA